MKQITFIAAFVFILVGMAHAQSTPVLDERQQNQRGRIQQGVASGEVTKAEATQLRGEQRRVKKAEKRAKADGKVSKKERVALHRKQNRASRKIAKQKHDPQDRP